MHLALLSKAARIAAAAAGILVVSAVVVWPVWLLATHSRRLYTALVGAAILVLAVTAATRRLACRRRRGTTR